MERTYSSTNNLSPSRSQYIPCNILTAYCSKINRKYCTVPTSLQSIRSILILKNQSKQQTKTTNLKHNGTQHKTTVTVHQYSALKFSQFMFVCVRNSLCGRKKKHVVMMMMMMMTDFNIITKTSKTSRSLVGRYSDSLRTARSGDRILVG